MLAEAGLYTPQGPFRDRTMGIGPTGSKSPLRRLILLCSVRTSVRTRPLSSLRHSPRTGSGKSRLMKQFTVALFPQRHCTLALALSHVDNEEQLATQVQRFHNRPEEGCCR